MLVDFPTHPIGGQTFTSGGSTWTWDNRNWIGVLATGVDSFNGRTGAVVLNTTDITGAGGAAAASIPGASTTPPLIDGTAGVGTLATYARADHVHPAGGAPAAKWTQIFSQPVSAGPVIVVTGLSQAYGDLLINAAGTLMNVAQILYMQVSTDNGATYSPTNLQIAPGVGNAAVSFNAVFYGYTNDVGLVASCCIAGSEPSSPSCDLAVTSSGFTVHTGGCNALRFQPASGSFVTDGVLTIYGR